MEMKALSSSRANNAALPAARMTTPSFEAVRAALSERLVQIVAAGRVGKADGWDGSWVSMQDIRRGPSPDNGLEVLCGAASFNDKMLGHGSPIRVREGQRVLFRLLNPARPRT